MNNKYLIAFSIATIIIVGTWFSGVGNNTSSSDKISTTPEVVSSISGHIKGNTEATIKLVEYSDLQCPACGMYYPIIKQLLEEFGDSISFEYRHFPLRSIHDNAEPAALATEAAGLQGKFWEMHDILFENQKEWSNVNGNNIFIDYAKKIEIDPVKFESDMTFNNEIKDKVKNDYQSGLKLNVNSTPSFFLNGVKMQNPRSYEEFRSIIQQFILAQ